jgi:uncharacterized protein (DUF927 family)
LQFKKDGAASAKVNGRSLPRPSAKELVRGRELELLSHFGVAWPVAGKTHVHCPFPSHQDPNPSWRWDSSDQRYKCSCGSGDIFEFLKRLKGWEFAKAALYIENEFLGASAVNFPFKGKAFLAPGAPLRASPVDNEAAAKAKARKVAKARTWWDGAESVEREALVYLRDVRGIPLETWPSTIRYAKALRHWDPITQTESFYPAIICAMSRAPGGPVEAIGRIYLSDDGKKAALPQPKKTFAPTAGLAFWIGQPGARLVIADGAEDAVAVHGAGSPFVCTSLGVTNIPNIVLPDCVREVVIFADRAKGGPPGAYEGESHIARARAKWEALGVSVRIVLAAGVDERGQLNKDANDMLKSEGPEAVRRLIDGDVDAETNEIALSEHGEAADPRDEAPGQAGNEAESFDVANIEAVGAGEGGEVNGVTSAPRQTRLNGPTPPTGAASTGPDQARPTADEAEKPSLSPEELRAEIRKLAQVDEYEYISIRSQRAKSLDVARGTLDRLVNAERIRIKAEKKPDAEEENIGLESPYPRGFSVDKETENVLYQGKFLCSPIKILAKSRDSDAGNWGLHVQVRTPDYTWRHVILPKDAVYGGGELIGTLALNGLEFNPTDETKGLIREFLAMTRTDARALCIEKPGWISPTTYALPDEVFGGREDETVIFTSKSSVANLYKQSGVIGNWKENVAAPAMGNSRLIFALSASFAACLLRPLGRESCGYLYRGRTTIGKTSTLDVSGSTWGGNGVDGFYDSWNSTGNNLESMAVRHNDNLLLIDELGQALSAEISKGIYMLGNGKGKGRLRPDTSSREVATWRILFICTGELSLEAKMAEMGQKSQGGQEIRMIDLEADAGKKLGDAPLGIFEDIHGRSMPGDFAAELRIQTRLHYGTAGREFLRKVTRDVGGVKNALEPRIKKFKGELCPEKNAAGEVHRAAGHFALVAEAGEFAAELGILPWPKGAARKGAKKLFREWIVNRGGVDAIEARRAIAQVREFIEQHGNSRFIPWIEPSKTVLNSVGFVRRAGDVDHNVSVREIDEEGLTYFIFPESFKTQVCKGVNVATATRALGALGALKRDSRGNYQRSERLPGNKGTRSCYVINAANLFCDGAGKAEK